MLADPDPVVHDEAARGWCALGRGPCLARADRSLERVRLGL